jgi:hypothetical protein
MMIEIGSNNDAEGTLLASLSVVLSEPVDAPNSCSDISKMAA